MESTDVWTIARANLNPWVARLLAHAEVIAPVRDHGDEIFAAIDSAAEVLWSFENPVLSPKHVLLPQTDVLAWMRRENGQYRVEPAHDTGSRVLLNARCCDTAALAYLRQVHASDLPDASILRRADALTVVTLACHQPCPSGFCVCSDAGPFLRREFDLQLTELADAFYVEIGSPKGRALVELAAALFRPATAASHEERRQREDAARSAFGAETCHFGSAMRRISTRRVPEALWESIGRWCLGCGGCTFACPMCYCFSIADRSPGDGCAVRCRIWDSCQYPAFTLEASGHNPRQARAERLKRRFYHKVSAQYFVRDDRVGCVGCGRCIKVCPGACDVPGVVSAIREGAFEEGRRA